eukprot:3745711-Rhodomonas_salina.2
MSVLDIAQRRPRTTGTRRQIATAWDTTSEFTTNVRIIHHRATVQKHREDPTSNFVKLACKP